MDLLTERLGLNLPEGSNIKRAVRGAAMMDEYVRVGGGSVENDEEAQLAFSDALADLMHLVRRMGWEWEELLARARMHHDAEVTDATERIEEGRGTDEWLVSTS